MTSWQRNGSTRSISLLIDVVQRHRRATVKEITEATGLSRSTVANLLDQLVDSKILARSPAEGDHVGRKPQVVAMGRAAGVLVGVELAFYAIAIAIEKPDGDMLDEIRFTYDQRTVDGSFSETLTKSVELTATALRRKGVKASEIRGIGLAVPAPVDHRSGKVISRDSLRGWPPIAPNEEFSSRLATALGSKDKIPALLGNDAQLGAWGTYRSPAFSPLGNGVSNGNGELGRKLMFIKVSEAIRVGFINNGEPDWGCSFPSGDFSHQVVRDVKSVSDALGQEIRCGRCGTTSCLSCFAAGPSVKKLVHGARGKGEDVPLSKIVEESNRRNAAYMGILESAGIALGRAIVDFISVAGYDEIVLGGILSSADVLVGAVQEEVTNGVGTTAHVTTQPKLAVARGAIELARDKTKPLFFRREELAV